MVPIDTTDAQLAGARAERPNQIVPVIIVYRDLRIVLGSTRLLDLSEVFSSIAAKASLSGASTATSTLD